MVTVDALRRVWLAAADIVAWVAAGALMVLIVPLLWPFGWVAAPVLAYWWLEAAVKWLRRGGRSEVP